MHRGRTLRIPLLSLIVVVAVLLTARLVRANGVWEGLGEIGQMDADDVKELVDMAVKTSEAMEKGDDLSGSWDELSPQADGEYEPDYQQAGMPELPALCKGSEKCTKCFDVPHTQLDSLRFRFEKLRKVNRVTKNMLRDSLSFGDAAAEAAGGVAGLVWAKEKEGIRESEANFNTSYDAKLVELLSTLKDTLQSISACEEKVFDETAWYERYGFIYYEFMSDAYRRPD
jgi:hypothetical protein